MKVSAGRRAMQVAIPLFPQFTALDGIGPDEVLQRIPRIEVRFVGHRCKPASKSDRTRGVIGVED